MSNSQRKKRAIHARPHRIAPKGKGGGIDAMSKPLGKGLPPLAPLCLQPRGEPSAVSAKYPHEQSLAYFRFP